MTESDNKRPAIFATSYFPPVAQMAAMIRFPEFLIEHHETFPKQTQRNRTVILTANGPMSLSVPVIRPNGNYTPTFKIEISYTEKWYIIHWRAIESAYNSSPYFLYYRNEIEKILFQRYNLLTELNDTILKTLMKLLKCDCQYNPTHDYMRAGFGTIDFRETFSYKHPERQTSPTPYPQVFADRLPFEGNVGILDLLFNLGPEAKAYLLNLPMQKPWNMEVMENVSQGT